MARLRAILSGMRERHYREARIAKLLEHVEIRPVLVCGITVNRYACLECDKSYGDRGVVLRHIAIKHMEYALTYSEHKSSLNGA